MWRLRQPIRRSIDQHRFVLAAAHPRPRVSLSDRAFSAQTKLHWDGANPSARELADDRHIPFVYGPPDDIYSRPAGLYSPSWPQVRGLVPDDAILLEPELDIDLLELGIEDYEQPRILRPDEHPAVGSPDESELAEITVHSQTRTRLENRKERKLRRTKAKEDALLDSQDASVTPETLETEGEQVKLLLAEAQASKDKARPKRSHDKSLDTPEITSCMRQQNEAIFEASPKEPWQVQKSALEKKFKGEAWSPRKRISPDSIAGVRSLHESNPQVYSTERLADYFQISPEAVRRILKSRWRPSEDEAVQRRERWERRGEKKWTELAAEGVRPPKRWRQRGVGSVSDGTAPAWRKGNASAGAVRGERWIEHRSPEELFARAAEAGADADISQTRTRARSSKRSPALNMSDRFL